MYQGTEQYLAGNRTIALGEWTQSPREEDNISQGTGQYLSGNRTISPMEQDSISQGTGQYLTENKTISPREQCNIPPREKDNTCEGQDNITLDKYHSFISLPFDNNTLDIYLLRQ